MPDVAGQCAFYLDMGFRLSEYIAPDGKDEFLFVFLQRKGNPHDIVFANGAGPRFHHVAFAIPKSYHFFYVCDLAAEMGLADRIEYGPGRHRARDTRCSSTCAIPTATASSCSTRTIR